MSRGSAPVPPERIATLLAQWLPPGSDVSVGQVEPVFGGNARRAVAFDAAWRSEAGDRKVRCVMLSAPPGRHVESDIGAEFAVLRALEGRGTRAPRAVAMDADGTVVGTPSIVLERLPGTASVVPILKGVHVEVSRAVVSDLVNVAAELHVVDAAVLANHSTRNPTTAVAEQVRHWKRVYQTHCLEPQPALESVFGWMEDHLPAPERLRIIHGDLRLGNVLHDGPRITGLLDWEMAHVGDPAEDIAWIYRPLWSIEAFLPLAEFVRRYERRAGITIEPARLQFWRVFSEVKFACISLTAAYLFATGQTANLRLADRAAMVPACLLRCFDWMEDRRVIGNVSRSTDRLASANRFDDLQVTRR